MSAINQPQQQPSYLVDGRLPYKPPYNSLNEDGAGVVGNPGRQRAIVAEMKSNHLSEQSVANGVAASAAVANKLEVGSQAGVALPKGGYVPGMRLVHFDLKVRTRI